MVLNKSNKLDDILSYNKNFVRDKIYEQYSSTKSPNKKIVILSCMDTRLTELLTKAMNIKNGDAKIIKNAGGIVMHPFGSAIKSILLSIYEFDVEDVIVVGHYDCGVTNSNSEEIIKKMLQRGIEEKTISILNNSRLNIKKWLEGFKTVEEIVRDSVGSIKNHPLIPTDVNVHGLIMDPYTGAIKVVINGYDKN